jgi:hypothetical protein
LEKILAEKYSQLQSISNKELNQTNQYQDNLLEKHQNFKLNIENKLEPIKENNYNHLNKINQQLEQYQNSNSAWIEKRKGELQVISKSAIDHSEKDNEKIREITNLVNSKLDSV